MVFVLDQHKKPLMPCSEKRARLLLGRKRAVVHRRYPFTIRLKVRCVEDSTCQLLRLKLDPGSKTTGWAILNDDKVIVLGELIHKPGIKAALESRRSIRRNRRSRHTRYREPGLLRDGGKNRFGKKRQEAVPKHRRKGWLPPSLEARIQQTMNLVKKLRKLTPITALSTEHVKFDTQLLENPDIGGVEYQQGTLWGYEVREYILERDGRHCAYCKATDRPLEMEHITPRTKGGSNRVGNLTPSCKDCNRDKDKKTAAEFGFPEIQNRVPRSLRDAASMNATRWRLFEQLKETGLPVECGTGARTKYQRIHHGLPKTHYYDAACVGASTPAHLEVLTAFVCQWSAKGRGNRQMCQPDKFGFPRQHRSRKKLHFGFMTGDIVEGTQTKNKQKRVGRVIVRASGSFYFQCKEQTRFSFTAKNTVLLQRNDGWEYVMKRHSPAPTT